MHIFHYAPQPNCRFNADANTGHGFAIFMASVGALRLRLRRRLTWALGLMKQVAWKLAGSILLLVVCVPLLRFSGWFGAGVLVGLVLAPLYWFDLGRALRSTPDGCVGLRLLGLVMGVPQALFGVLAALIGLSIIGWVLYNSFWVPSSHYSGGFLTLGIGPVLVLVGSSLVVDAFRKSRAHDARIDT